METNYRLYAYTGEARGPQAADRGWKWGEGREQEGVPVCVYVYLAVYRVL